MRIHKYLLLILISVLTSVISSHLYAGSVLRQNDPVALLQYIADNMIAGLKANQATLKTKPQVVYQLAYQYVVPYADLAEMSRRVLPPQIWNSSSASQRAQFQKAFTTTLIRTYASALTAYKDQTIRFYPIRGAYQNLTSVEVASDIESSENQPIRVSYRLVRVGGLWKLLDLSVEGVSMLDSFRAQFADLLSQGSMDQLLKRMGQHNQG